MILLPILAKIFETLLVLRMSPVINDNKLISNHQFGFRLQHETIDQVHRLYNKIHLSLEKKHYRSVIFLDISQTFDHDGLLYKIRINFPCCFYNILKFYLANQHFFMLWESFNWTLSNLCWSSVLGLLLYLLLFMNDLSTNQSILIKTLWHNGPNFPFRPYNNFSYPAKTWDSSHQA